MMAVMTQERMLPLSLSLALLVTTPASAAQAVEPSVLYEEVRARNLELHALPPAQRKAEAALEVGRMGKLLEAADGATAVYAADILKMAGCEARSILPALNSALSKFPEPKGRDADEPLSMVVPSHGAWGSIHNAITFIEGDDRCGADI